MSTDDALAGIESHAWESELDVGLFLAALIKMHLWKDVIEVGVLKGLTSARLLASLPPEGSFVGIDIEDQRSDAVKRYMNERAQTFLLGDSLRELARLPDRSADLIFLDGDHSFQHVRAEFSQARRIIRPSGIVCSHDYVSPGVRAVFDSIALSRNFDVIAYPTSRGRGLVVVRCRKNWGHLNPAARLSLFVESRHTLVRAKEKLLLMLGRPLRRG